MAQHKGFTGKKERLGQAAPYHPLHRRTYVHTHPPKSSPPVGHPSMGMHARYAPCMRKLPHNTPPPPSLPAGCPTRPEAGQLRCPPCCTTHVPSAPMRPEAGCLCLHAAACRACAHRSLRQTLRWQGQPASAAHLEGHMVGGERHLHDVTMTVPHVQAAVWIWVGDLMAAAHVHRGGEPCVKAGAP